MPYGKNIANDVSSKASTGREKRPSPIWRPRLPTKLSFRSIAG